MGTENTADAVQHGGNHYKNGYQHWNLLPDLMFGPEYYIGCATKYVTRHDKKNKGEDIAKAIHFTTKLIELIDAGKMHPRVWNVRFRGEALQMLREYAAANLLQEDGPEMRAIMYLMLGTSVDHYQKALAALQEIAAHYWTNPPEPPKAAPKLAPQGQPIGLPPAAYSAIDSQFGPEGYWGNGEVLWKCKKCGTYFKAQDGTPPRQGHPTCATGGPTREYVDQDR